MSNATTSDAFSQFSARLRDEGVRPALAYLVSLTEYRFIAIFRFEAGMANACVFYDREAPAELTTTEVPDTATYCCFVRNDEGVFTTADSMADVRLSEHPARAVVRSYCGVPVMNAEGVLLGTLCHYDLVPRDPAQIDLELMLQVASMLAAGDHVPPYPAR